MRILLTNDDGIEAPGIMALKEELQKEYEVYLVAPKEEKSACGHAITFHDPIRIKKRREREWAVSGTPADCVKLGISELLEDPPHLVISGINRGANLGSDLFYSGTVSAAMEGVIMGYPALAFSLVEGGENDFTFPARFALEYVQLLERKDLLRSSLLLNINFPPYEEGEIEGISYIRMGRTEYTDIFKRRIDPRGKPYYWMGGQLLDRDDERESDVADSKRGYITITPLQMDLTDYRFLEENPITALD